MLNQQIYIISISVYTEYAKFFLIHKSWSSLILKG
jgi:hypothetical protein